MGVATKRFRRKLTLPCVYSHPDRSSCTFGILGGLWAPVKGSLVVYRDFNVYLYSWGSEKFCRRGRQLADEIASASARFVVANNGDPTFLQGHSTTSAIDVAIHTPGLPMTWCATRDTEGSDHFPIHIASGAHNQEPLRSLMVVHWDTFCSSWQREIGPQQLQRVYKKLRGVSMF